MKYDKLVGGFSRTSKMPGLSYGIPAAECKLGSFLRKKVGSVCSKCYARKGFYVYRNPQNAQYRRIGILLDDIEAWRDNMIAAMLRSRILKQEPYFRWHDSGDLQSRQHLEAIVDIAKALPNIRFWLPTKEALLIRQYKKQFPKNLTVRISAPNIGQTIKPLKNAVTSSVSAGVGYTCVARQQGNRCGECRACWDKKIVNVDYRLH